MLLPYSILGAPLRSASIQFPDPHFKTKHHKRRVVQPELARPYVRVGPRLRARARVRDDSCPSWRAPSPTYHLLLATYHLLLTAYFLPLTSCLLPGALPRRQHRAGRLALRADGRARAGRGHARGQFWP